MNSLIRLKITILPLLTGLTCFALSPAARAQCPSICDLSFNTAVGDSAFNNSSTGTGNTAIGNSVLGNNTTGYWNTAIGSLALELNTTGTDNTSIGYNALGANQTGNNNTATGFNALSSNSTGTDNTATGFDALKFNIGSSNTATGFSALQNNGGDYNTADGVDSLEFNTTGIGNTAVGVQALFGNTTGTNNTAEGNSALIHNTTGGNNIALGLSAGANLTTGSRNIDIGNAGVARESATIRIGTAGAQTKTFIAAIHGVGVTGAAVVVNSSGQLGTAPSSERFKDEIKPMDNRSESILALKPVTFRYKKELDPDSIPQFGLVAEEVEKVNPNLVVRDKEGKPYSVRYDQVNAMLLNEFLKEHCKVESLEKAMAEQQKENAAMRAMLKEQAARIQKVSAQLELNKSTPQTVLNDQ